MPCRNKILQNQKSKCDAKKIIVLCVWCWKVVSFGVFCLTNHICCMFCWKTCCILQSVSPLFPLLPTDHPPFLTSFEQSPPLIKNSAQTKLANTELIEHKNSFFFNTNPSSVCEICNYNGLDTGMQVSLFYVEIMGKYYNNWKIESSFRGGCINQLRMVHRGKWADAVRVDFEQLESTLRL